MKQPRISITKSLKVFHAIFKSFIAQRKETTPRSQKPLSELIDAPSRNTVEDIEKWYQFCLGLKLVNL
jgi:hypothetical protein